MGHLEGKVAVVTGAGRGLGRAIALLMAQEGARVVVNDAGVSADGTGHDSRPADEVVSGIRQQGGTAVVSYDSVTTMEGGQSIIQTALNHFGRIDILVNNAGIIRDRIIFMMTEEEWDAVIAVHLKGHFSCTHAASIIMRQQRYGRIINFSAEAGLIGNADQANYGAANAGIAGFTRAVARELGRYGITVNCVVPRAWTRMTVSTPNEAMGPLPAWAPECIAPMVCYLASDDAWNINGQIFLVYGGTVGIMQHPMPPVRSIFKPGFWTLDELSQMVPQLMAGVTNPAPPAEDLQIPPGPSSKPQPTRE